MQNVNSIKWLAIDRDSIDRCKLNNSSPGRKNSLHNFHDLSQYIRIFVFPSKAKEVKWTVHSTFKIADKSWICFINKLVQEGDVEQPFPI